MINVHGVNLVLQKAIVGLFILYILGGTQTDHDPEG